MYKLIAIWKIIFAQKVAVFTWKEKVPKPLWFKVPTFSWILSDNWNIVDLSYIEQKIEDIINTKMNE